MTVEGRKEEWKKGIERGKKEEKWKVAKNQAWNKRTQALLNVSIKKHKKSMVKYGDCVFSG